MEYNARVDYCSQLIVQPRLLAENAALAAYNQTRRIQLQIMIIQASSIEEKYVSKMCRTKLLYFLCKKTCT